MIAECGLPTISTETSGSSEYCIIPLRLYSAAFLNVLLISSLVTSLFKMQVKSVREPSGVGTLTAIPSIFPFSSGMTRVTAFAAPVVVGMIETAAARALLRSLCGKSSMR